MEEGRKLLKVGGMEIKMEVVQVGGVGLWEVEEVGEMKE